MEEYYYLDANNQRIGPLTLEQLIAVPIYANTKVWKAGLAQWTCASNIPEVAAKLDTSMPPPPPPEDKVNTNYTNNKYPCPPTNLIWGVLITIFCCLPFGIIAIYQSSLVERRYYNGDYEGALRASKSAANWCIASIVIMALIISGYFGMIFLAIPLSFLAL